MTAQEIEDLVGEFQEEFKAGPGLAALDDEMVKLLRGALSNDEMTAIFGDESFIDPSLFTGPTRTVWENLERLGPQKLAKTILAEHPQVIALVISKLSAEASAATVAQFEPGLRNEVMRRVLSGETMPEATVALVEDRLNEIFVAGSGNEERQARRAALAEIANRMEKVQADDFITSIETSEPEEARAIRSLMFAFEDIPAMPKKSRLLLFDDVPTETVTLALRGADAALAEAVTSSLAARARRMVEAELTRPAEASKKDVAIARRTIASLALRLSQEGKIALKEEDGSGE